MIRTISAALAGAAMMMASAAHAATAAPTEQRRLIPTEELARRPLLSLPKLSPDGTMVTAMLGTSGASSLGLVFTQTGEIRTFGLSKDWEIASYRWAGNNIVLISLGKTTPWLEDEAYMTRLVAYDVRTKKTRFIGKVDQGLEGDDVLYVDPDGKWLLLSIQKTIYDWPSVHRVELEGEGFKQVVAPRDGIWEWYADDSGFVRAGTGIEGDKWTLVYRGPGGKSFRMAGSARIDDVVGSLGLLRFALDSDEGYILSSEKTGRDAVYRFNYSTLELGELVFEAPANDVSNFTLSADGKAVRAAYYTDVRDRVAWFDAEKKAIQADIDAAVPGKEAWIVSESRDGKMMLVLVTGASDPGSYYLYQPTAGVMNRLAMINERLRPYRLAPSKPVSYKARDGLTIPAYLTLPLDRPAQNLPLIVLPHGGPYGVRERGDYDPEVQLLANRGQFVARCRAGQLQPRIHRLALQRQDSEHALMHAPQRLAADESLERFDP